MGAHKYSIYLRDLKKLLPLLQACLINGHNNVGVAEQGKKQGDRGGRVIAYKRYNRTGIYVLFADGILPTLFFINQLGVAVLMPQGNKIGYITE